MLVRAEVHLMNLLLRPKLKVCFTVMEPLPIGNVAWVTMAP